MSKQKVFNIADKLNKQVPVLQIDADTSYQINSSHKTVLALNQLQKDIAAGKVQSEGSDALILELLLGEQAAAEVLDWLEAQPCYAENNRAVMIAVMAGATGSSYEAVEEQFFRRAGRD